MGCQLELEERVGKPLRRRVNQPMYKQMKTGYPYQQFSLLPMLEIAVG